MERVKMRKMISAFQQSFMSADERSEEDLQTEIDNTAKLCELQRLYSEATRMGGRVQQLHSAWVIARAMHPEEAPSPALYAKYIDTMRTSTNGALKKGQK